MNCSSISRLQSKRERKRGEKEKRKKKRREREEKEKEERKRRERKSEREGGIKTSARTGTGRRSAPCGEKSKSQEKTLKQLA
jgi:hypothetical protein